MRGMDLLGMTGKPMPKTKPDTSAADAAVAELIANPTAATFKAAMDLCNMAEESGEYDEE